MRLNQHQNTTIDCERARILRNDSSPFEQKLWVVLREQVKIHNLKFRRQQVIHPFIADFACMQARLIVELDGDSHDTRLAYDSVRDKLLAQMGFTVLRFRNQDVVESLEYVLDSIVKLALELIAKNKPCSFVAPLPNPPREGAGIPPVLLQGDLSIIENRILKT